MTETPGGLRWSPVLIAFRSRSAMRELGVRHALGVTFPVTSRFDAAQFVSGVVVINASAQLEEGFDRAPSVGTVVQHELGHAVGLAHILDPFQLMSPMPVVVDWGTRRSRGSAGARRGPVPRRPDRRAPRGDRPAPLTGPGRSRASATMARPWARTSSTSRRRSTTRTTSRTSVTRTPRSRPTSSPGTTGSAARRCSTSPGPTSTASSSSARPRPPGMDPQTWVDEMAPTVEGGLGQARHRLRRLHPHDRAPPREGRPAAPDRRPRERPGRHLPRDLRGPVLRVLRGVLHRGRARRRDVPDPRDAGRAHGGGELLLPALGVRGAAARALRAAPQGRAARDPAQRGPRR